MEYKGRSSKYARTLQLSLVSLATHLSDAHDPQTEVIVCLPFYPLSLCWALSLKGIVQGSAGEPFDHLHRSQACRRHMHQTLPGCFSNFCKGSATCRQVFGIEKHAMQGSMLPQVKLGSRPNRTHGREARIQGYVLHVHVSYPRDMDEKEHLWAMTLD